MTITVPITAAEAHDLRLPVNGKVLGGFQTLALELQRRLHEENGSPVLRLDRPTAERVVRYADPKYGSGGFQGRIRSIAERVDEMLPDTSTEQPGLF